MRETDNKYILDNVMYVNFELDFFASFGPLALLSIEFWGNYWQMKF
jgi:hypothetical protein